MTHETPEARQGLNLYYGRDGIPPNDKAAFKWFCEGAKRNDATSLFYKSIMRRHGFGCNRDIKKSFSDFIKALKINPSPAMRARLADYPPWLRNDERVPSYLR